MPSLLHSLRLGPPLGLVLSIIMLFVATLAVAAVAVSAAPLESRAETVVLPLKQHSNVSSIINIVQKGKARIDSINAGKSAPVARAAAVSSGSVTNEDVSYVAPVVIGGTTYSLIVDTGCKLLQNDGLCDSPLTLDVFQLQTPGAVLKARVRRVRPASLPAAQSPSPTAAARSPEPSTQTRSASAASPSRPSRSALPPAPRASPA